MDAFDRNDLLNDKITISLIITNMTTLRDYYQIQLDQYGPNRLKTESGKRKKRNIEKTQKLVEKLVEAHKLMSELHEDNVCVNGFTL